MLLVRDIVMTVKSFVDTTLLLLDIVSAFIVTLVTLIFRIHIHTSWRVPGSKGKQGSAPPLGTHLSSRKSKSRMFPALNKNMTELRTKKSLLAEFGRTTNIEGINNAGRAPSVTRLTIWLTIFVLLVALTLNDVVQLVQEYISGPVDVSTTLEHKDTVDFPSVTVCNRNVVHCGRLKKFIEKFCETNKPMCENKSNLELLLQLGKCEVEQQDPGGDGDSQLSLAAAKIEAEIKDDDDTFLKRRKKQSGSTASKDTLQQSLSSQNQSVVFKNSQDFLQVYLKLSDKEKFMIGHQVGIFVRINNEFIKTFPVEGHGQELHLQRSGLFTEYSGGRNNDGI